VKNRPIPPPFAFIQVCSAVWIALSGLFATAIASPTFEQAVALDADTSGLPRPAVMTNFTVFVETEGAVRQEVSAEIALLYQSLGIAHLRRLHVDFIEKENAEKDTLDAPEGFLYLRNFTKEKKTDTRMRPDFPFYRKIGGKLANIDLATTTTRLKGPLPDEVVRNRNDIDLIGTAASRIVYRRSDGTFATCLRAYRDNTQGKVYGVDDCEIRRPTADKSQSNIIKGKVFVSDDALKGINIRGAPTMTGTAEESSAPPKP
jgi:hypothetical protein